MRPQQLRGFVAKEALKATGGLEDPLISAIMIDVNKVYRMLFIIIMTLLAYSMVRKLC